VLVEGGTAGRYVPGGYLVYASGGTLFAAPFDADRLELDGSAIPIVEDVRMAQSGPGSAQFTFSNNGRLAYVTPYDRPKETQLLWIDRHGSAVTMSPTPRAFNRPRLSHDGRRVVVEIVEPNGAVNLWVYDRSRQTWTQLTFGNENDYPEWSPRGDQVAFVSNREGRRNLFVIPAEGGEMTRLTNDSHPQFPMGWSPDGRVVLFSQQKSSGSAFASDLWALPLVQDRRPRVLVSGQTDLCCGRLTPDGRFLAYQSWESGRPQVYARSYDGSDHKWTISTGEGGDPRWTLAGGEIVYVTDIRLGTEETGYKISAVSVTSVPTLRVGAARTLFERQKEMWGYDVAPDGEHFVVAEATQRSAVRQIVLVPDWFAELRAKVPVSR
jgi:eukaryotic-like serine/threonine-protein kinase